MIEKLKELLPPRRVTTAKHDLDNWGRDWTRNFVVAPSAVVFPETVEEVTAITRLANAEGFALVPSGGRTGLSAGAVASHGEVVVSFDRMNRILDFNEADRIVRCEAGVVTANVHAFALDRGLFYPVDFASSGSSQIGGNVATNAGGIKVIRYGMTRDWIAGIKVVTGAGEVLELNRGLVKNATGYDLRHLFIGSEGTLGFVVEADLRLAEPPEPSRVMVLGVDRMQDILSVLTRFQADVALSAFEFFSELAVDRVTRHRSLARPLASSSAFYALLEFDANAESAALAAFEESLASGWVSDGVMSQSDAQARALWALREGITESIAPETPYKNDLAVRVSDVPGFLDDVDRAVGRIYPELEICWFGHIGDGNVHLNILRPPGLTLAAFYERCDAMSPGLFELVAARGGSISAEHGVGMLKRDFLGFSRSSAEIEIMRAVKTALDPKGVMNPGKLLP
ncbi:MAG: FAD-binding oxidoreductase [Gammaproteobacteria bacterium]|nr:FAD-binding oxidoreductase [Gammaproteobacteria bacterium]MYK45005.1 FAD-binding oxidoreductase [Gammaproteobacteria bacterium]